MQSKIDYKKQGKKNRVAGSRFELRVRANLESKGWIVDKWSNNVAWLEDNINRPPEEREGKLVKVKNKFLGPGKPMMLGAGFPDFIAFNRDPITSSMVKEISELNSDKYNVMGVEAKSNGILDREEKEKCEWLLDNNIFSKILIAKKGQKRGEIVYEDFYEKYK